MNRMIGLAALLAGSIGAWMAPAAAAADWNDGSGNRYEDRSYSEGSHDSGAHFDTYQRDDEGGRHSRTGFRRRGEERGRNDWGRRRDRW